MGTAGGDLAAAMIEGMVNGIGAGIGRIVESAKNMASQAFEAAKDFLDINSPSRKFRELGEFTGEGYDIGLQSYNPQIAKTATGIGETAIGSLKKSMSGLNSAVNMELDGSPTIRPVLDLTAIRKDSSLIGNMIKPPTLTVDGAYANAASLAASTRATEEAHNTKTGATPPAGDVITFNQTIQSPKAISQAESYRHTNNLMSQLKNRKAKV
jgi:hypothetical protein